eukprot:m.36269 g.36269  ORF g.36269 m.36269 type:complete len:69 (+) comp9071_c0_seq1:255-461(+)
MKVAFKPSIVQGSKQNNTKTKKLQEEHLRMGVVCKNVLTPNIQQIIQLTLKKQKTTFKNGGKKEIFVA